jgi:transposase InsO family protein
VTGSPLEASPASRRAPTLFCNHFSMCRGKVALHRYNTVRRHSRLGQQSPITYENSRTTPAALTTAA